MNAWPRLLLVGTVGVLAAVAVLTVVLPRCGGPDLLGGLLRQLRHEEERREALGRRDREVVAGLKEKDEVVRELAGGGLTLREALDSFRRMRERLDDGLDEVVGPHRAPRDDEGLYRNLLSWVEAELRQSPRRQEVLDRLDGEWRLLRPRQGAAPPQEGPTIEKAPARVPGT